MRSGRARVGAGRSAGPSRGGPLRAPERRTARPEETPRAAPGRGACSPASARGSARLPRAGRTARRTRRSALSCPAVCDRAHEPAPELAPHTVELGLAVSTGDVEVALGLGELPAAIRGCVHDQRSESLCVPGTVERARLQKLREPACGRGERRAAAAHRLERAARQAFLEARL